MDKRNPTSFTNRITGRQRSSFRILFPPAAQVLLIAGVVALTTGCHNRPNWGSPGTIGEQRQRAVLHDPYPNNTLGPAIESGRPLGFDRPLSEPTSTQSSPYARRGARNAPYVGF